MDSRLDRLVELLDAPIGETAGTSVRLPATLREAATVAVDMGFAVSIAELTVKGLRDVLDAVARQAALEAHFAEHPEDRPTLVEVAAAAAELDGIDLPLELIERAAGWLATERPGASADDVLLVAAGLDLARSNR